MPASAAPAANAAAGDAKDSGSAPPMKRSRRSNPKVKTGCTNCKQRRIKCDEKRPACTRCVRGNRVCTGYPPPSRSGPLVEIRIAPKPAASPAQPPPASHAPVGILLGPTVLPPRRVARRRRLVLSVAASLSSPTLYQPSNALPLDAAEALYFHLFHVQTASQLSGYFNSTFWSQRVLQECHSEKAVLHAVVALGALYKTLEQSWAGKMSQMGSVLSHWQAAVKQYSDACNEMLLISGETLRSHRARLMASILLAYFDSFIGDHKQAIVQIQTGLGLLECLRNYHPHHRLPSRDGYIEEDLVEIFTRLAIQAKSYDMAFHFPQPYVIRLSPQCQHADAATAAETVSSGSWQPEAPLPYRFESVLEARLASDRLNERLIRFIERLQIAKNNLSNVLPTSWIQYGARFRCQLDAWSEAFEPIFRSRLNPGVGHLERLGISALKMFQINTNILFLMMFCDTEVQFDSLLPQFKAVVDLGWEVVGADERRALAEHCSHPDTCQHQHGTPKFSAGHVKPSFSADLGIVPPLFVVATKCREPRIRRRAIHLLRSSARREGMWDSELAANLGQWIMQIEEFDQDSPPGAVPTKPVPEERRVMVKTVDFDLRARFADVRVGTRAVYNGYPDARFRETRLTW